MLHISLEMETFFIPHNWCLLALLALRSIQLMTGKPRPRYSALQLLGESGACVVNHILEWTIKKISILTLIHILARAVHNIRIDLITHSRVSSMHCNTRQPQPLFRPTNHKQWWGHPIIDHVSYPTDSPTATRLGEAIQSQTLFHTPLTVLLPPG